MIKLLHSQVKHTV